MKTTTWWFEVIDENSAICGEEFFVEVEETPAKAKEAAIAKAQEYFPNIKLHCLGKVSLEEAEMMGLDTY